MVARSLFRHGQCLSDLFIRIATRYQRQHFAFALGQLAAWHLYHALHRSLCGLGIDQRLPYRGSANGTQQFGAAQVL